MSISVKQHYKHAPVQEQIEQQRVAEGLRADIAALRAELVAIAAKLDADAGVTDTDYNTLTGGTPTVIA